MRSLGCLNPDYDLLTINRDVQLYSVNCKLALRFCKLMVHWLICNFLQWRSLTYIGKKSEKRYRVWGTKGHEWTGEWREGVCMHLHVWGFNWVESGRYAITSCRAERAHVKNPFNLRVVKHVQNRQRCGRSRSTSAQSLLQRCATQLLLKVIHWPLGYKVLHLHFHSMWTRLQHRKEHNTQGVSDCDIQNYSQWYVSFLPQIISEQ